MAVTLLRVLVLGVIAAAADDIPITWLSSSRASLLCVIPDADRIITRRPPPPLDAGDEPKPRQPYLWRRGSEELKQISNNGTLEVFRKKNGTSEGIYQCAVRHYAGFVLGYPLRIQFAYLEKHFSVQPANATAWLGESYVLNCSISSGPDANITWQKDGKSLPRDDRYHVLKNQLIILNVTSEDAGLYRCKAKNTYANKTRVSNGGRLQVEQYSGLEELKPSLLPVEQGGNIIATTGDTVRLACPVTGIPKTAIIWEYTAVGYERTAELEFEGEILEVQTVQDGVYSCHIKEHRETIKIFNISVAAPVSIVIPPMSQRGYQASTVRFNCTAFGYPPPTVTWYKNGKQLELTGRIAWPPSPDGKRQELLIRSLTSDDAGIYQCFAHNGISVASSWALLNVTSASKHAPSGVQCGPTAADHVLVTWPAIPDSIAYTVQVATPDGPSFPVEPSIINEKSISLEEPLTVYVIQVRAYIYAPELQKYVASDMSSSILCQGQGVAVGITRLTDGFYISWKQFTAKNHTVEQWILQYREENTTWEHNVTLAGDVSNFTIFASPDIPLQVRLLGTKQLPWLQQNLTRVPWRSTANSGAIGKLTGKIDKVEVSDVGPTRFTVHWRSQEADTSDETYLYTICTHKLDGDKVACFDSRDTWTRVEDLMPSTEYFVRVKAEILSQPNLVTEFTHPVYVTTQSNNPVPIKDLTYKMINATTLRVSWNSAVDKYTVYYNDKLALPINGWASVDTEGHTVLIPNVDTSEDLYVIVSGYNPGGYSSVMHIPVQVQEPKDLDYTFNKTSLYIKWPIGRASKQETRGVRYSQNLTKPLDEWSWADSTSDGVVINGLEPTLSTYIEVTSSVRSASRVFTVPPKLDISKSPTSETIKNLKYEVVDGSSFRVSWDSSMDKYTVYYNNKLELPIQLWPSVDAVGNTVLLSNMDTSKELYVVVSGFDPVGYSSLLHIPLKLPDGSKFNYTFTKSGLTVKWTESEYRSVYYSQNRKQKLKEWTNTNVTEDTLHLTGLNPSQFTYLLVEGVRETSMLIVPPRHPESTSLYISSKPIMDLKYKMVNSSTLELSWNSDMHKYTVFYSDELKSSFSQWPSIDTTDNRVLISNVDPSKELNVIVLGYHPVGYSFVLHIPVGEPELPELSYSLTSSGLSVTWPGQDSFTVRYSQNLIHPLDNWRSVKNTGDTVELYGIDGSLVTYIVVMGPGKSARVLTAPPRPTETRLFNDPTDTESEGITKLSYEVLDASTIRVSWESAMDKYTVFYSSEAGADIQLWPSVDTLGNTAVITDVDTSRELHVVVLGYDPVGYSPVLHIPAHEAESKRLKYEYTSSGVLISWHKPGARTVNYSQNLTEPLEQWHSINVTDNCIHLRDLDPLLTTYVLATIPGHSTSVVLTVPPRPIQVDDTSYYIYLSIGVGCGVLLLCLLAAAIFCIWHRRRRGKRTARSRKRTISATDGNEEEMTAMRTMGSHLANGGTSKDAGEPLLNGHVHITENPIPLKTPNGRVRRDNRDEATFDLSRCDDPDLTVETTLNTTTSTVLDHDLFDTSRAPEYDLARSTQNLTTNNSFNKLPDDNMNSELTRSTDFELDNSKILPTLQPNG